MSLTRIVQGSMGLGVLLLSISSAFAAPIPPAATVCTSCHMPTGMGLPNMAPMIAGKNAEYLTRQIDLFIAGERSDPLMTPMAGLISDPKKKAEAINYFASLSAPEIKNPEHRGDHAIIEDPARKLVYQGDWNRNIQACSTCHGASGIGVQDTLSMLQLRDCTKARMYELKLCNATGGAEVSLPSSFPCSFCPSHSQTNPYAHGHSPVHCLSHSPPDYHAHPYRQ